MTERPQQRSGVGVLSVVDAAVHFGGVKAVDGISLRLAPGLISGIIGPNGSGKSTLITAITRLVDLTSGRVELGGEDYSTVRADRVARLGVSRTFQTVRLLPDLTAAENVQLGADIRGARRGHDADVAEAMIRTGLEGFEDAYPGELSYGYQRRVEIARALAMRPSVLLLDEPTAGMNQSERVEIADLLKALRDEGLTQLLVEHDVQLMIDTCDYIFAMNFGKLIAEGTPQEVVRHPSVQEAYLGKKWREHA